MPVNTVAPPSEDKRWRIVGATMRKHGYSPDALIETLHSAQETFGFLDDDALRYVAQSLGVSPSRVYGVVTFYNLFTLKPQGEHTCVVCLGTACYVRGGVEIVKRLSQTLGVGVGETTPDGKFTLEVMRCIGACGLAPALLVNDKVVRQVNPDKLNRVLALCE